MKSISEFEKLYLVGHSFCKPVQKIGSECTYRSHRGVIVHLSSALGTVAMSKMNFVDLAGSSFIQRKLMDTLFCIVITGKCNCL